MTQLLTAEQYWKTCDVENTELVDGRVSNIEHFSAAKGEIVGLLSASLVTFLSQNKLGRVSVRGGFTLRRRPDTVRGPDVSFISHEKLGDQSTHAFIEGAPTLAVEVVSPGDLWSEVENKVQLYLETGTKVVWIVDPKTESLTVRTKGESRVYSKTGILRGEPILPGFKLPLKEIFSS